jgi:phosphatidylserine synthase
MFLDRLALHQNSDALFYFCFPFVRSLADCTSFGVAPAITLLRHFADEPFIGVPLAAFHFICTATRLAKFMTEDGPPGLFSGMPCPFAGVLAAAVCAGQLPTQWIIALCILHSCYMISWETTYIKPFSVHCF